MKIMKLHCYKGNKTRFFNVNLKLSSFFNSDKPGHHNFELLKKLVLPDGSVLRAQLPGRPTRDCLFADPARDGTRFVILSVIFLLTCLILYHRALLENS